MGIWSNGTYAHDYHESNAVNRLSSGEMDERVGPAESPFAFDPTSGMLELEQPFCNYSALGDASNFKLCGKDSWSYEIIGIKQVTHPAFYRSRGNSNRNSGQ
ncbi:hypothetical protein NPIL_99841 [Nephila pilipes]|uniref:Uncharacterized protein n=1 Tax=Nephila pilipes TaxID=299642 RepID=A0A8X6NPG1_NEPPI|nr:hypothetical protein NPIL_99841 [Nephila pilipes]